MKKLYQNPAQFNRSLQRERRSLKQRRNKRRGSSSRAVVSARKHAHHHIFKDCIAPEHFSITENPEGTLAFFDQVLKYLHAEYSVNLLLEPVRRITPDAILYLLSVLDMNKAKHGVRIKGSAPKDDFCKHIFLESGFYGHVISNYRPKHDGKDILEVRSHERVIGEIAHDVVKFANEKLKNSIPVLVRRKVYTTILECMGNTREHAYTGREGYHPKWWLMAIHDDRTGSVSFAILDNGQGIPKTVKKKIFERLFTSDHKLIVSALRGEFRTRTNEEWRGKGLPRILKTLEDRVISKLAIVSNHGFVHYGTDQFVDMKQKFVGSLVSWTIEGVTS